MPWLVSWAAAGIIIVMISATGYHIVRGEISSAAVTFCTADHGDVSRLPTFAGASDRATEKPRLKGGLTADVGAMPLCSR